MGTTNSRQSALSLDNSLIAGTQKHLANQSFTIGKQTYTAANIVTMLQGRVTTAQAVITAKSAWQAAIKADADEQGQTKPLFDSFVTMVQAMFQGTPDVLADFGLVPRKTTKKTVAVKQEAIVKSKATRVARGTKGTKQKAAIKGAVPSTPPAAGATSSGASTTASTTASTPQVVAAPQVVAVQPPLVVKATS